MTENAQVPPKFSSAAYWEQRYSTGGNSGAGSYGRLATFKAEFLNRFIVLNGVKSVVEFGCGDGNQLSLLTGFQRYTGVDVSQTILRRCRAKFPDPSYAFVDYKALPDVAMADLAMSIDVIFHLVEDQVFEVYMRNLFSFAQHFIIVYSSDYDDAGPASHVRHRNVSRYVARTFPDWDLSAKVANLYPIDKNRPNDTSFCDFLVFSRQKQPQVPDLA